MNGRITLPETTDFDHVCEVMGRIEGTIVSAIRGDYPKIVARFDQNFLMYTYTIEISTNDFRGLVADLQEDGFF